jgi:uncharacterized protein YbjT (DUF2867 family)
MKILTIGGTGLIGSKTVAILRQGRSARRASAASVSTNGSAAHRLQPDALRPTEG